MEEDKNTLGLHPEVREEDRVAKAVALFREGYNCSQSVVTAFADLYGFTREQALHMSASFGGGIGRMRETCGAACGMFLLAGLEKCAIEGKDRESKAANYALVQELAEEFKKRNGLVHYARCENPRMELEIDLVWNRSNDNPAIGWFVDLVRQENAAEHLFEA